MNRAFRSLSRLEDPTVYEILRVFRQGRKRSGTGCTREGKCVCAGVHSLLSDYELTVLDGNDLVTGKGLFRAITQLEGAALGADIT